MDYIGFLAAVPIKKDSVARLAYKLYTEGKITLTQRRLGPPTMASGEINWDQGIGPGFEYIATGK